MDENYMKQYRVMSYLSGRLLALGGLFILFFLLSCRNDKVAPSHTAPVTTNQATDQFVLSFSYGIGDSTLRALGQEAGDHDALAYGLNFLNENIINSVQLFIFDKTSGSRIIAFGDSEQLRKKGSNHNYTGTVSLNKAQVANIANKAVRIVLVANASADYTSVADYGELQAKYETYADLNNSETPRDKFLMDGEIEVDNIAWATGVYQYDLATPIKLRRALAKIRLRIGHIDVVDHQNATETKYEVVDEAIEVKLVHYAPHTSLLSTKKYTSDSYVSSPYRKMKLRTYPGATEQFYGAFPFYAGEYSWVGDEPTEATHMTLRIKLRPQGTTEPGRYYHYRIPISYRQPMDGVPSERLYRVERNYLYDVVSNIEQLGSLDEGELYEVNSSVAIKPWESTDQIDGSITDAHYLIVRDTHPAMANIDSYDIDYISSLPVEVRVTKAFYEYYDIYGDYVRVVFSPTDASYKFYKDEAEQTEYTPQEITEKNLTAPTGVTAPFDGTTVSLKDPSKYLYGDFLTVSHRIPDNYVPFMMEIEVKHIQPSNPTPLSEMVYVIQYPWLYVTANKSIGPRPTEGDKAANQDYADFRHHTLFGDRDGDVVDEAMRNDMLNRVSIKVPSPNYKIGNPVGADGYTKTDAISNQLVSPEFIIASQYGLTMPVSQNRTETSDNFGWMYRSTFANGYGPEASPLWLRVQPYKNFYNDPMSGEGYIYIAYKNAEQRCHDYFEDEYGTDGDYTEYYIDGYGYGTSRTVRKRFKYQGRWRIPTAAEITLLDEVQTDPKSVTKELMTGSYYWSARTGKGYGFNEKKIMSMSGVRWVFVRCVFDTYALDDKKVRHK